MNFDHFQILRAIGKGSFGKVGLDPQSSVCLYVVSGICCCLLAATGTVLKWATFVTGSWLLSKHRKNVFRKYLAAVWHYFISWHLGETGVFVTTAQLGPFHSTYSSCSLLPGRADGLWGGTVSQEGVGSCAGWRTELAQCGLEGSLKPWAVFPIRNELCWEVLLFIFNKGFLPSMWEKVGGDDQKAGELWKSVTARFPSSSPFSPPFPVTLTQSLCQ